MKLTLFKIRLVLRVIGASGPGRVFSEADRSFKIMSLKSGRVLTKSIKILFLQKKNG